MFLLAMYIGCSIKKGPKLEVHSEFDFHAKNYSFGKMVVSMLKFHGLKNLSKQVICTMFFSKNQNDPQISQFGLNMI